MARMVTPPVHELDASGIEALLSEDFRDRGLDAKRLWRAVLAITLQDAVALWPVHLPENWRPPPVAERMQRGADQVGMRYWRAYFASEDFALLCDFADADPGQTLRHIEARWARRRRRAA
jgi:hypothetical protein